MELGHEPRTECSSRLVLSREAVVNFKVTDNARLLSELEPSCVEVRDKIATALAVVFENVAAYNAKVSEVSALVSAGGRNPVHDGPDGLGHELEQAFRDFRRAIEQHGIAVPMPHNRHTAWVEQQNQAAAKAKAA